MGTRKQIDSAVRRIAERFCPVPRFCRGGEICIAGLSRFHRFDSPHRIACQWRFWRELFTSLSGPAWLAGTGVSAVHYGVCWNQIAGTGFDYLVGVEALDATRVPDGLSVLRIEPQRYAVFDHPGHVAKISQTIGAIWMKWLPGSGYRSTGTPSFERYTAAFDPATGTGGIEIWIPIRDATSGREPVH